MKDVITIRRDLHRIPELGFEEYKTKKYILNYLKDFNCKIEEVNQTGLILFFDNDKPKTIGFRADMDALPIEEVNSIDYLSEHSGLSHACGHDANMAMLLDFSKWVNENISNLNSNILCIFQPSEEITGGALSMINSNFIVKYNVSELYALHLWPKLLNGFIHTKSETILAKSSELNIDITGKSVHAANREDGIDSILIGYELINKMYIFQENLGNCLLNFGKITGGTLRNIVAEHTHIEATMRAFDDITFNKLKQYLFELKSELEDKYHCLIKINLDESFPLVYNNQDLVIKLQKVIPDLIILDKPFIQAEDFGNYTKLLPCVFSLIGTGDGPLLHTNEFSFDEEILKIGVEYYKKITLECD